MRWPGGSLRLRLSVLILVPLVLVAALVMAWRFDNARDTAEGIFDRNLVMLNLAVSRDVAYSGGDTLSETTSNLFKEAAGGTVYYHVYGPDGSFVTGYSSPPIRGPNVALDPNTPLAFDAVHQGEPVRAVSLAERVEIDGISGLSVVTVWQQLQPRQEFAQKLAYQAMLLTLILVLTVATVVFFGVALGLRPLKQLEAAIQKRSTTDLSPIERHIPTEARGIVQRLNTLFGSLTEAQSSRERLISNAAHQLRNPVAAIHTMAQAIETSQTLQDSQTRASELVGETRQTMRLTQQLLSFERIKGKQPELRKTDLNVLIRDFAERIGPKILSANVEFSIKTTPNSITAQIDETLLQEALTNLVENALQHGGPNLNLIALELTHENDRAVISVENDGQSIPSANIDQLFERFTQSEESQGSGLGLAIVQEIVALHHGQITLTNDPLTRFEIQLDL